MKHSIPLILFLFGLCLAGKPCERFAEIVGDFIDFLRSDYYVSKASNWMMDYYIEEAKKQVQNHIGVDITSATEREQFACRVSTMKNLKELYDFMSLDQHITYEEFCFGYKYYSSMFDMDYSQFNPEFVREMYSTTKDLANWMDNSGFPERFPPSTSHAESVEALQEIVDKMDASSSENVYAIRGLLTDLLPLGPLVEWEIEYGNENRSTPEEVVGWMEDSSNIFEYAAIIKENIDEWFSVGSLKTNYDMLLVAQHNYDKFLWYEEALRILKKIKLDTSDCPKNEWENIV